MLTIDFSDVARKVQGLDALAKQVPFVMSVALTNAMKDAREAEVAKMQSVFDRPTRYTLNSLQVTPARKNNLTASLAPKEGFAGTPAWKYLGPEVEGGRRRHKSFEKLLIARGYMMADEYAVPSTNLKLDANGNVPGGLITRILSALGAQSDRMNNSTKRSRARRPNVPTNYFVNRGARTKGIYLRVDRRKVTLIMLFVKAPNYTARFPFYQEARRVIPPSFRKHFHATWDRVAIQELRRPR